MFLIILFVMAYRLFLSPGLWHFLMILKLLDLWKFLMILMMLGLW